MDARSKNQVLTSQASTSKNKATSYKFHVFVMVQFVVCFKITHALFWNHKHHSYHSSGRPKGRLWFITWTNSYSRISSENNQHNEMTELALPGSPHHHHYYHPHTTPQSDRLDYPTGALMSFLDSVDIDKSLQIRPGRSNWGAPVELNAIQG